jgi:hypothetical protein
VIGQPRSRNSGAITSYCDRCPSSAVSTTARGGSMASAPAASASLHATHSDSEIIRQERFASMRNCASKFAIRSVMLSIAVAANR